MMDKAMVSERLQGVFREVFEDDALRVGQGTARNDIDGWDSMADIKLILGVEEEYHIKFTTSEITRLRSVDDLIDALARRGIAA
jgi:acyl carrier protein